MNEESIFLEVLQKSSSEERQAFLAQACAGNMELRRGVEQLLKAHEKAGDFLQAKQNILTIDEPISERPGAVIGPYKLLEQIGEGGFGIVFMAEQQQPVRRKVALKVLKAGMDTRQVIARFEAERQALALMDHPNIARVFDGGETAGGRPYFVMELVNGMPITGYCDQSQLAPTERLELFLAVCLAVQHAHQKGIIHRDIKPSNVLVTLHDGTPVVKIIDFGIAKATGLQLTEKTLFTNFAQLIGTPLYMSPEQAALSGMDLDTRSDIYSLGVLLYELLTGTTPFARERFKEGGYDEMRRIIREEEPPKPSTRISTLGQAATTLSTQRKSSPKRLSQLFRGELDWVVMKCLEKDRNRRYETANGVARDIESYLHDEPVQACPPSVAYRFRKFARRNKAKMMVAGLILCFLVVLGCGIGWIARDRAARIAVMEERVKQAVKDAESLRSQAKWPEALEAVKRAEGFLAGETGEVLSERVHELRRDLEMALRVEEIRLPRPDDDVTGFDKAAADSAYAEAFRDYGIDAESLEPAEAAERVRASAIGHELTLALDYWARYRRESRGANDAGWRHLVAVAQAADGDDWRGRIRHAVVERDTKTLKELATSEKIKELPLQTLSMLGEALPGKEGIAVLRVAQRKYPGDFWINFQLAWCFEYTRPQDWSEAVRYYTAALALRPRNIPTHVFLGNALKQLGRLEEAMLEYRRAGDLGPDRRTAHMLHERLGDFARGNGQTDVAIAEFQEAVACNKDCPFAHFKLATLFGNTKQPDAAIEEYRTAIHLKPDYFQAHFDLALVLASKGQPDAAIEEFQTAIRLKPDFANAYDTLGRVLLSNRQEKAAINAFRKALELEPGSAYRHFSLGYALQNQGMFEEASAAYRKAIELNPDDRGSHINLVCCELALYGKVKTRPLQESAIAALRANLKIDPTNVLSWEWLGCILRDDGQLDAAIAEFQMGVRFNKDSPDLHFFLGRALSLKGQADAGIAEYREAIRLKKNFFRAHHYLVAALRTKGELDAAFASLREAERFAKDYSKSADEQDAREARKALAALANLRLELRLRQCEKSKDANGCRATAEMWEELKREELNRKDNGSLYDAACYRAVAAAVFHAGAQGDSAAKDAAAEADRAMRWLKQAVAAGFNNSAHIKVDKDLDALRDRKDFKKLLAGLEAAKEKEKK